MTGNTAEQAAESLPAAPTPAARKLSSARPDEEVQGGEFWVLLRSVAIVIAVVVGLGWLIG